MPYFTIYEDAKSRESSISGRPWATVFVNMIWADLTVPIPGGTEDDELADTELRAWIRTNAETFIIGGDPNAMPVVPDQILTFKEVTRKFPTNTSVSGWKAELLYTLREDFETEFDTSGATALMVQSIATKGRYPYAAPNVHSGPTVAPDLRGLINVSEDGVEGVERVVGKYDWVETHILPATTVTQAYRLLLSQLTGGVNDANWRVGQPSGFDGFPKGTVLFLGAVGRRTGELAWQLQFKFSYQRDYSGADDANSIILPNMALGGGNLNIKKEGWHYLSIISQERMFVGETPASGPLNGKPIRAMIRQPTYAFVDQIYPEIQFSQLGIPNPA